MQRLIEDLLDYHRVQETVGRLDLKTVRFDEVVEQVLEDHRLAVQARRIRPDLRLDPVTLQADEEKLRAVVDEPGVECGQIFPGRGYDFLALRQQGDEVVLDIRRRGPRSSGRGPRKDIRLVLSEARTLPADACAAAVSGLAIAKEFVLAHGGRIEVLQESGPGAHFRVTLPSGAPGPEP